MLIDHHLLHEDAEVVLDAPILINYLSVYFFSLDVLFFCHIVCLNWQQSARRNSTEILLMVH